MERTSSQQSRVSRFACEPVRPAERSNRSSVLLVIVFPPTAPAFPVPVPLTAIFVFPAGPLLGMPVAPALGRLVIVAHGDAQEGSRDVGGFHGDPGAGIAGADIPPATDEGVTLPVVLKDVGRRVGNVLDRQSGDDHPLWRPREIDADAHVHLRLGGAPSQAGDGETESDHRISHGASSHHPTASRGGARAFHGSRSSLFHPIPNLIFPA